MDIEIEMPDPPKFKFAEDKQNFDQFYARLKTSILRQLEQIADEIDRKQDKN